MTLAIQNTARSVAVTGASAEIPLTMKPGRKYLLAVTQDTWYTLGTPGDVTAVELGDDNHLVPAGGSRIVEDTRSADGVAARVAVVLDEGATDDGKASLSLMNES